MRSLRADLRLTLPNRLWWLMRRVLPCQRDQKVLEVLKLLLSVDTLVLIMMSVFPYKFFQYVSWVSEPVNDVLDYLRATLEQVLNILICKLVWVILAHGFDWLSTVLQGAVSYVWRLH